jgi:hypothetical protein
MFLEKRFCAKFMGKTDEKLSFYRKKQFFTIFIIKIKETPKTQ